MSLRLITGRQDRSRKNNPALFGVFFTEYGVVNLGHPVDNAEQGGPAMFEHSNIRVNFNKADYSKPDIAPADRKILRRLAGEVAEIAARPEMKERERLWREHNDLKKTRPLILCDPEHGWNEIIPDEQVECTNSIARHWEVNLRKQIFWGNEMHDDYPVTAFFNLPLISTETPWNIKGSDIEVTDKSYMADGGAYHIDTVLENYEQLKDIVKPELTIERELTERLYTLASEIFDGLLETRINTVWFWSIGLTDEFTFLRGMDRLFMDFYDAPDRIHELMRILFEGVNEKLDYLEQEELLSLNNDETYVGSGGIGYTEDLPAADFSGKVRTKDMWGLAESQVTVGVSPEMFAEFIFPYQKKLMERFGLSCYGCCEPMDDRFDIVKEAGNLRRVSVSPWANPAIMSEKLKHDYIFSLKPNPSHLAVPQVDEELIRRETRKFLNTAKNNCLELIMKDNHTLGGNRENVKTWTRIVGEEIDRL